MAGIFGCPRRAFSEGNSTDPKIYFNADKVITEGRTNIFVRNMNLTDKQEKEFLPLLNEYTQKMAKLEAEKDAMIKSYISTLGTKQYTDKQASQQLKKMISIMRSMLSLREAFAEKLIKVLPGTKVVLAFHIEENIQAFKNYRLAMERPMVK